MQLVRACRGFSKLLVQVLVSTWTQYKCLGYSSHEGHRTICPILCNPVQLDYNVQFLLRCWLPHTVVSELAVLYCCVTLKVSISSTGLLSRKVGAISAMLSAHLHFRWDAENELNYRICVLPRTYFIKNQVLKQETMMGKTHCCEWLSGVYGCIRTQWVLMRSSDGTGFVSVMCNSHLVPSAPMEASSSLWVL